MQSQTQKIILLGALFTGLVACQGKNPLDRSNDPTKDYTEIKQDSSAYQDLKVEKVDNGQSSCGKIYDLDIKESAARNLIFVEGEERSYVLKVRSYMTPGYQLSLASSPDSGISLKKLNDQGDWQISWRPKANTVDRRAGYSQKVLTLAYRPNISSASATAQKCLIEAFHEDFTLTINLNRQQPTLNVDGLKEDTYKSSGGKIGFKVFVNDPASTPSEVPFLGFSRNSVSTSEIKTVGLRPMCSKAKATKDQYTWEFDCDVDLSEFHSSTDSKRNGEIVFGEINVTGMGSISRTAEVKKTIKVVIDQPAKELEKVDPDQSTSDEIPVPQRRPNP